MGECQPVGEAFKARWQGFRRGSIMRMFRGANLARTRAIASFYLCSPERGRASSGTLSRQGSTREYYGEEENAPAFISAFLLRRLHESTTV